jgi:hypothetical protein
MYVPVLTPESSCVPPGRGRAARCDAAPAPVGVAGEGQKWR